MLYPWLEGMLTEYGGIITIKITVNSVDVNRGGR
jgi:hypothetical protein